MKCVEARDNHAYLIQKKKQLKIINKWLEFKWTKNNNLNIDDLKINI